MTTEHLLEEATQRHRAGDLVAARGLYAQILAATPDHVVALFRLGLLELQAGHHEPALSLLEAAVEGAPEEPRHHIGLGQARQAHGQLASAADSFRRALE